MPTPDDYIACRTFGHAWFEYDSNWTPIFGTPITLRCERCGGERRDIIDALGRLGRRYYLMPEGYFYASGSDRPSRADMRLALIQARVAERREARQARKVLS